MLSPRAKVGFWLVIGAILLSGAGRIFADPTRAITRGSLPAGASPVIITEFMASNASGLTDEDGDHPDWIELYNRSASAVNLEGWTLTDNPANPDKWTFRPLTLESGARYIVFASGKNRRTIEPEEGRRYPHTNFRLAASGGFLGLYSPTSLRHLAASEFTYPVQYPDISYGIVADETGAQREVYFERPTPAAENDVEQTWAGLLEPVEMSAPHGLYMTPFTVTLAHPDSEAVIRYTTDGSEPALENGEVYAGPVTIAATTPLRAAAFKPGFRRSPVATRTYVFPADVPAQPDDPAGWPQTWGVHAVSIGGYEAGTPVLADYGMDPKIAADPQYGPQLPDALAALPSISLVMNVADFTALYSSPQDRGVQTERPVSVEMFYPDGERAGFQVDAGLRIQGGAGRWEFMPKHSFRLFFKQRYGAGKLNYALFPDSRVAEFDTLVLRAGVDRSFAGHPSTPETPVDHRQATYLRDEWTRASQIAASGAGSHGVFVHLYINGLYWGLYNVVERPDASFAASYFGGEKDRWFSANHGGAVGGQPDRFDVLLRLAQEGGLDDPQKYATMLEFIDPIQFSDYMIVNWYAGNSDWPENNWYVDVQNPAGRNYFFIWDAEMTWDDGAAIVLGSDGWEGAPYPNVVKLVFEALIENADFRMTFADRLYRQLHHDGSLTDAAAAARWNALADAVEPAIVAESARWGDVRYDEPVTPDDWLRARDNVLAQMEGNAAKLIDLARAAGYYPAIDPPQFSQQGGEFDPSLALRLDAPAGEIYYTTDGTDPREAGTGQPSSTALRYVEPIALTTATTVKARTLAGGEWSALNEAAFRRPGQRSDVRITEIMYNPIGDEEAEFLELKNVGEVAADLSGAYFDGITYVFPDHTTLGPGEFAVLIRDLKSFRRRYPEVEVFGVYGGKLSNGGEEITLYAADGSVLFSVTYDDRNGWPLSADGAGDSIVLLLDAEDPTRPESWRASARIYGSPGEDDENATR